MRNEDKIYKEKNLRLAWERVKANRGAGGVDGQTLAEFGADLDVHLKRQHDELRTDTYQPQPVRQVMIPKPGKPDEKRPPGIPTVPGRAVQMATLLVLEPIFEADFLDCSFGFRPKRSAHHALNEIRQNLVAGRREVYDADLQSYFDTIPHDKLLAGVQMRVVDRSVLGLIRMWLKAVVIEPGQTPGDPPTASRPNQGTPQGGVISPLLANLYLHWFDKKFHAADGPYHWANARLVRYADDLVIMARYVSTRIENFAGSTLESWMKLTINRAKTRVVKLCERGTSLDFLGFTFRYDRDRHGRPHRYLNVFPWKKALARERLALHDMTGPRMCFKPIRVMIGEINRHLTGWGRYFDHGYPRDAFREINWYVRQRLTRHLKRRSQRPYHPPQGVSWYGQLQRLGLVYL